MNGTRLTSRRGRWLVVAVAIMGLAACDSGSSDSSSGGGGDGKTGAQASDKQYAVEANMDGGAEIKGEADQQAEGQFMATVAGGELVVYLVGADGTIIFFQMDMNQVKIPGPVTVQADLGAAAALTVTSLTGVWEADGSGNVKIDSCPDAMGAELIGSFTNVGLANVADGSKSKLNGTFKATVAMSDGSHVCEAATTTEPEGGEGPPGCDAGTCDGPCCPYMQCIYECSTACALGVCQDPMKMMECMTCTAGCMDECGVSDECKTAAQALNECAAEHECEGGTPEEDPCVGANCCAEYKAAL
jgi:hypothetical protein